MSAAAAARGHLRASHADREQVIDTLKAAFVQGRLAKEEFDLRVGQTFASRTYAEIAALTADLPAGLIRANPPRDPAPAQAQQPVNKALMWGACVIIVGAAGSIVAALTTDTFLLLLLGVLAILMATPVAGTLMLDSWREKRSGGQLPPRPAGDGQALEDEPDGSNGNDLILSEARKDIRARPMPDHRVNCRTLWSLTVPRNQRRPASLQVTA
jgi:Domain of unknown function (DUF1707)